MLVVVVIVIYFSIGFLTMMHAYKFYVLFDLFIPGTYWPGWPGNFEITINEKGKKVQKVPPRKKLRVVLY